MDRAVVPKSEGRIGGQTGAEPSSAALFALLWNALADMIGTAAAAILLRRAARRAAAQNPELAALLIVRETLEYRYTLPSAWNDWTGGTQRALQNLVAELLPLLVELTGPVVVRHLAQIPELRERGIVSPQEEEP